MSIGQGSTTKTGDNCETGGNHERADRGEPRKARGATEEVWLEVGEKGQVV